MSRPGRLVAYSFLTLVLSAASLGLAAAAPAPEAFETMLGPAPINHITNVILTGDGAAVATLNGNTLKVSGSFQGMPAPATDAHVIMGDGIAIPGSPILNLTVSPADHGDISGSFTLTKAQVAALREGRLYIQINSAKGPAPDGNLRGWLLVEHKKAGQDEPIMGDWFLPQGKGLKASRGNRQS